MLKNQLRKAALGAIFALGAVASWAMPPTWVLELKSVSVPAYRHEHSAVVLLRDETDVLSPQGKWTETHRIAYKILQPKGARYAAKSIFTDWHDRVDELKGWLLPPKGNPYPAKSGFKGYVSSYPIYMDMKYRHISLDGAIPGSIVAFEYKTHEISPLMLQQFWPIQDAVPVLKSHFEIQYPDGWSYRTVWLHHDPVPPTQRGGDLEWTLTSIPAIRRERSIPPRRALAAAMAVTILPSGLDPSWVVPTDWQEVSSWTAHLDQNSFGVTPELRAKVESLTRGQTSIVAKIQALAHFAQVDVRYAAIEIGMGDFRPHPASLTLKNLYGDCKDKATLLKTMLAVIGVKSYLVLVTPEHFVVQRKMPSLYSFDHVILALELPAGADTSDFFATVPDGQGGKLLFFDPTNPDVPVGMLPGYEQGNWGLLVKPQGGALVRLPLPPPALNRVLRSTHLQLEPNGGLEGTVSDIMWGAPVFEGRERLLLANADKRTRIISDVLSQTLSGFQLTPIQVSEDSGELMVNYGFGVPGYASASGNLLLVKPCVLGDWTLDLGDAAKPRLYPYVLGAPRLDSDLTSIALPPGYTVLQLPQPVKIDTPYLAYHSKTTLRQGVRGATLHYTRSFEVKKLSVPAAQFPELLRINGAIAQDQRALAVLQAAPQVQTAAAH